MKKRLLCLAFSLLALFTMVFLTSCGEDDETTREQPAKATAVTITINTIKGAGTTKEAIAAVQDELNKITEAKLNVHVVLQFFDEEEYFAKMIEMIEAGPSAPSKSDDEAVETDEFGNEIGYDEQGREITIYPEVKDNQVDIFLIRGYDDYKFLRDFELLEDLSSYIKESTDGIDKYFVPNIINEINLVDNSTYFIPTNDIIGEYEYLLINKDLYDKYDHSLRNIKKFEDGSSSILNIKPFLIDLVNKEPDVIPLFNISDLSAAPYENLRYIGSRFDKVKISNLKDEAKFGLDSLMSDIIYTTHLELIMQLKALKDYMPTSKISDTVETDSVFGAAYIRGDKTIAEQYKDDYYVVMTRAPMLTTDQLYDFGYAVSGTATYYANRCMDVINLMNKDENVANLLAYGVQRLHYNINENGKVFDRSKDYNINFDYIPNKFLLLQNTEMTEQELKYSNNNWALAKTQNSESGLSPYLNFVWQLSDPENVYDYMLTYAENYERMLAEKVKKNAVMRKISEINEEVTGLVNNFKYNTVIEKLDDDGNVISSEPGYKFKNNAGNEVQRTLKEYITVVKEAAIATAGNYKELSPIKTAFSEFWDANRSSAS